jgi:hypothetical protein
MRTPARLVCALALLLAAVPAPARAATPAPPSPRVLSFTLSTAEAAKGEAVIARYTLNQPARQVSIAAGTADGTLAGFSLPQTATSEIGHVSGTITFSVPVTAGTLSPLLLTLAVDGQLRGSQRLVVMCDHPWFFAPRVERCPFEPVRASPAAMQRFERGLMLWLQATDSIYVLRDGAGDAAAQRWARYDDLFEDGDPERDPNLSPPAGLQHPVRGFGRVWRTQPDVRRDLGWATEAERGYTACYATAFGGWKSMRSYVNTPDGGLLELETYYLPTRWRVLDAIAGEPVRIDLDSCLP